jgi:hypothetical protein
MIKLKATQLKTTQSNSNGSALMIALLVIASLSLIGMWSLRNAQQENIGAGNGKAIKQAKMVSEIGLHHIITFIQQQGEFILAQRLDGEYIEIDSTGKVQFYKRNAVGVDLPTRQVQVAPSPMLNQGPKALGNSPQIASYRVRIEGFTPAPPPSGQELSMDGSGNRPKFCLMEFNARGFVAPTALPDMPKNGVATDLNYLSNVEQVIEQRTKAAVVLGPFLSNLCQL